jgi:hypothetical protein
MGQAAIGRLSGRVLARLSHLIRPTLGFGLDGAGLSGPGSWWFFDYPVPGGTKRRFTVHLRVSRPESRLPILRATGLIRCGSLSAGPREPRRSCGMCRAAGGDGNLRWLPSHPEGSRSNLSPKSSGVRGRFYIERRVFTLFPLLRIFCHFYPSYILPG